MIDPAAIETALRRDWLLPAIRQVPGAEQAEVSFAEERGTRPALPYATLRLSSVAGVARDEQRPIDAQGVRLVVGTRVVTASVQCYGPGARRMAEHARSRLFLGTVADLLRAAGIVVYDATAVQNLTGLDQTRFEERGQFDARFAVASSISESVGLIERVEGDGAYTGADGAVRIRRPFATTIRSQGG